MIFDKINWQRKARSMMAWKRQSYGSLAHTLKHSKSTLWAWLNKSSAKLPLDDYCHICTILGINPVEYIIRDERQLKLI